MNDRQNLFPKPLESAFRRVVIRRAMRRLTVFATLAIAMAFTGRSSVAGGPPPDPPLVATPPDPCAWTIEVEQKKPRQLPPDDPRQAAAYKRALQAYPRMLRVRVEKAGSNRHQETLWDNGKKETLWIYKGWVVFQPASFPADQAIALPATDRNSPVKDGTDSDFPDFSWIRPEAFVKTVAYHGQPCHYYEDKEAPPLKGGDTLTPTPVKKIQAWIDVKTRLPVAVEDDAVLKTFHFLKEAPTSMELTGVFATAYDNAVAAAKREGASPPDQ